MVMPNGVERTATPRKLRGNWTYWRPEWGCLQWGPPCLSAYHQRSPGDRPVGINHRFADMESS